MGFLFENSKLRAQAASLSANQLLLRPYFWTHQLSLLAVIAVSLIFVLSLGPYTSSDSSSLGYLNWVILATAAWGTVIAVGALARLDVEMSVLAEIEKNGTEYLKRVKSDPGLRVDLDRLEEDTLPNNASLPPPAMIRLFQHICKDARDRRFESSITIIQPYREEPLEDIFKLQNLQKIALWLGILGTFVGLLVVINNTDLSNVKSNEDFAGLVRRMFEGLLISFGASLVGLEVAVILGLLLLLLRRRQSTYFKIMETAVVTMNSLARNAIVRDSYLNEFMVINETVKTLSGRVYEQTQSLSARLQKVSGRVDAQTEAIRDGIGNLSIVKGEFEDKLQSATVAQKEFIDDVRKIYTAISLKDLTVGVEAGIRAAGKQLSDTLDPNVKLISKQLTEFNRVLESLKVVVEKQSTDARESTRRTEATVKELALNNERAAKALGKQVTDSLKSTEDRLGRTLSGDVAKLTAAASQLSRTFERNRPAVQYRPPTRPSVAERFRDWWDRI